MADHRNGQRDWGGGVCTDNEGEMPEDEIDPYPANLLKDYEDKQMQFKAWSR